MDTNQALALLRQSLARIVLEQKRSQEQYDYHKAEVIKWDERAKLALNKGKEALSVEAIKSKIEHTKLAIDIKKQLTEQTVLADKLKRQLEQATNRVEAVGNISQPIEYTTTINIEPTYYPDINSEAYLDLFRLLDDIDKDIKLVISQATPLPHPSFTSSQEPLKDAFISKIDDYWESNTDTQEELINTRIDKLKNKIAATVDITINDLKNDIQDLIDSEFHDLKTQLLATAYNPIIDAEIEELRSNIYEDQLNLTDFPDIEKLKAKLKDL